MPQLPFASAAELRRARKLKRRSAREQAGALIAEGAPAVSAALQGGLLRRLLVTEAASVTHAELLAEVEDASIPIEQIDEAAARDLSETVTPQGILGIAESPVRRAQNLNEWLAPTQRDHRRGTVVVLVQAQDPGNVGTIIRTAAASGVRAVVLTSGSVDPLNGKCVRAGAGALFTVPIFTNIDADELLEQLRSLEYTSLATTGRATQELYDPVLIDVLTRPVAWLFGNEARGLPSEIVDQADLSVRIPLAEGVESLNLAAAAAVCLFETRRVRNLTRRVAPN